MECKIKSIAYKTDFRPSKKENYASVSKTVFHFMFISLFLILKCKQSLTKKGDLLSVLIWIKFGTLCFMDTLIDNNKKL